MNHNMTAEEKIAKTIDILLVSYSFAAAIQHPYSESKLDKKTGAETRVQQTGNFEKVSRWALPTAKFINENIYNDELWGILKTLGGKCNFEVNSFVPGLGVIDRMLNSSSEIVLIKNKKTKWQDIAKQLEAEKKKIGLEIAAVQPKKSRIIQYVEDNFYYKGKLIDFPDPTAVYALLVKALYFTSDSKGFCSYKNIDEYFVKHGQPVLENESVKIKRIHNALQNLYRKRRGQKNHFPYEASDGQQVIKLVTGQGLVFHNPEI